MLASTSSRPTPTAEPAFPCGSTSTSSVGRSAAARDAARFTAVVVLPTPPFWLAMVMILDMGSLACSGRDTRFSRGAQAARRRRRLSAGPGTVPPGADEGVPRGTLVASGAASILVFHVEHSGRSQELLLPGQRLETSHPPGRPWSCRGPASVRRTPVQPSHLSVAAMSRLRTSRLRHRCPAPPSRCPRHPAQAPLYRRRITSSGLNPIEPQGPHPLAQPL